MTFETVVGSTTLSPNALALNSAITSYVRTNVTFTFGSNAYAANIASTNLGYFTFSTADRGKTEAVDSTVSASGVGAAVVSNLVIGFPQRSLNGSFLMTVNGTIGQNYTVMASTSLLNWTPALVYLCTNSPMTITNNFATNYTHRF